MTRKAVMSCVVVAIALVATLALGSGAGGSTAKRQITVKPSVGAPSDHFAVSFRAPDETGHVGATRRYYTIGASVGSALGGCASTVYATAPPSHANAMVHVLLRPAHSRWCVGTFKGRIDEIQAPFCPAGKLCPAFLVLVRNVGRFTFRVTSRVRDLQPPKFAGLDRAFACTPGPQRPGQTTPFTLSWKPARDDVTPASRILYDVFVSTRSAAENFARPSWTTPAGATSFRTPGLPSHGTLYFIVRAKDQAGLEDRNRVERRGLDPCV